jgi:hypothetical protein
MIIWIVSYPRSGNTWVRSLISTYLFSEKENTVFENIKKIINFPNIKHFKEIFEINEFSKEELKNKKKKDKKKFEISKYWIAAQNKINLNKKITFLKTHNFGGSLEGNDFTNSENTLGVIYLVRDPRSVAVSNAHHNNISLDQSVNDLLDEKIFATNEGNLLEFRSSWRVNYLSWKNRQYPKIIIRYEDLHKDTFQSYKKILNFINTFQKIDINDLKIKDTIDTCKFENLSNLEDSIGFSERLKNNKFFRKGSVDEWKTELNKNQIKKIENAFSDEMKDLKYL